MVQAVQKLDALLEAGSRELLVWQAAVRNSGLLDCDLRPSRFDSQTRLLKPFRTKPFNTLRGHPLFSQVALGGAIQDDPSGGVALAKRAFVLSGDALFLDIASNTLGTRTLYTTTMALSPDEQWLTFNVSYVDQLTSKPLVQIASQTFLAANYEMVLSPGGWDTSLAFNLYSGQVQLSAWHWLPAQNHTWVQVSLSVSAETISGALRAQLGNASDDRLVLFFRQPHGYMIAASHGKFYSHSDVDRRYINPLTNPPNLTAYRLWTCLESDDALIRQACQQLFAVYQSWPAIPSLSRELALGGEWYWAATGFTAGSLPCTVLALKKRAAEMGQIDASRQQVDQKVAHRKGLTFVILGVVSGVAVILPLLVGSWLASRLHRLSGAMDQLARLQFTGSPTPDTTFREIDRFQTSFVQMERGLQAFAKFVPQAVVKVLIAGQMNANDVMKPEVLTVMFVDIEGFCHISETVSPQDLVAVCMEYFESMCSNIVKHHGTVDKFIGDCIMAIWNAPERLPGHERDAVAAALAMQTDVQRLHRGWQRRGLPVLRFRLGVHTGLCLVGNFGCSYRVSYTCLGDAVNLAARLEALNKNFGTYICVSHATYEGCRDDFHFRLLASVSVPGSAAVLPVYEVLCEAHRGDQRRSDTPDPVPARPTGEDESEVEELLPESVPSADAFDYQRVPSSPGRKAGAPYLPPYQFPPRPNLEVEVVYHWVPVDRAVLLRQSREYEEAYAALAAGDRLRAEQLLMAEPLLDIPDKAWTVLSNQLDHGEALPWDGVFYFREN
eukprot:EG_transcript_2595